MSCTSFLAPHKTHIFLTPNGALHISYYIHRTISCPGINNVHIVTCTFSNYTGMADVPISFLNIKMVLFDLNIYHTHLNRYIVFCAGLIVIPGAALGQVFGGFVIRYWKLKVASIIKLTILMVFLASLSKSCFFINCDMVLWDTDVNDR